MTTSLLTPAEQTAIDTLPLTSTQVLLTLLNNLYAEPGFSDVEVRDIATNLEMDQKTVKGAVGHLNKVGLVSPDHVEINGKQKAFLHSSLHRDVKDEAGNWLPDDKSVKAEAVTRLEARLAFLNDALMQKGMTLAEAEAVPMSDPAPVKKAKRTKKAVKALTFKTGPAIIHVMQFDDAAMCESYGVTVVKVTKGYALLEVKAGHMNALLNALESRARGVKDGWDQPLWFAASAYYAHKALTKAILEAK